MISINGKKYNNSLISILLGEYTTVFNGIKKKGISPFISVECDNIYLGLETVYDINAMKKLKINEKMDISKYITDIIYDDKKGWISLMTGSYKCFINKLDDNNFYIEFNCETKDCDELFNILINEKIEIDFK